ncbi:TPA: hypothetical protein WHE58_002014, partial [Neisseria meningitidis]
MLFRKTTAAVLAATLMLNGCTLMLWGMNNPVSETITRKHVDKDQIRAFGVVAEDNAQLEKGSLVMMGGKYWFVVNPEDSAKLTGILKAGLDKPFQIVEDTPYHFEQSVPADIYYTVTEEHTDKSKLFAN